MNDYARPLIGVTCRGTKDPLRHPELYGMAISRAGGIPEYLYADPSASIAPERLDGLLIPGGRDIPPARYGEGICSVVDLEDEERVDQELRILGAILKYNKPVFGICYGMQLINVLFGGSLYQDIASYVPHARDHRSGEHGITVTGNPFIQEGNWTVNSSHHQAVRSLGAGLRPFAYCSDGVLEAFRASGGGFLLGVQWHPERSADGLSDALFRRFVSACLAS
ncbi:MAG: gamma-glutamyl-gamma-aminobutyrate hydrolase family protein [Nitrospiraceae bacterium]|nr:gamma-glutamyl-gamma-aminobutyrate hydrolase family protein [Nitrospiraceae bacterium]